jgi:hypothetical protein
MGMFDGMRQTDADVAQSGAPQGFFASMMAARGMPIGGRRTARQQELVQKYLNEEMEREVGDATSVDVTKALPNAYFNAARRLAAIGGTEDAQKLYAAGMQAAQTTAEHAASLAHTKAQTSDLDEAPTEFLETTRQRDMLAEQAQKFAEDTPTGAALRKRIGELDARLTVLNERGAGSTAALPREVVLAQNMTAERRAADPNAPPVTTEEIWNRERQTSQRAQDYAIYVEREVGAGRAPVSYTAFTPEFQGQVAAGAEGGKRAVTRLDEDEELADQSLASIGSIKNSLDLLNEGVRSGTLTGTRQAIARAAATLLGEDPSAATVNTDAYIASSAPRVVEIVRALAPVTDQDKDFINAAVGGALDVATPEAMRKILEMAYRTASGKVERYNTRLSVLGEEYTEIAEDFRPRELPKIDFGAPAAAPAAQQRVRIRVDAQGNVIQ